MDKEKKKAAVRRYPGPPGLRAVSMPAQSQNQPAQPTGAALPSGSPIPSQERVRTQTRDNFYLGDPPTFYYPSVDFVNQAKGKGKKSAKSAGFEGGDEESDLLSASESFASQIDSHQERPPAPRSVAPHTYRRRGRHHYPARHQQPPMHSYPMPQTRNYNHLPNVGPLTMYQPLMNSAAQLQEPRLPGEEESVYLGRIIAIGIERIRNWINQTNYAPDVLAGQDQLTQEIAQHAVTALHNLRAERDAARRECQEKHIALGRARREKVSFKEENDGLRSELRKLHRCGDKSMQQELEASKGREAKLNFEYSVLEKQVEEFHAHHIHLVEKLREDEESHFKQVQALEGELKQVRARNAELAKIAGVEPEPVSEPRPEFKAPTPPPQTHDAESGGVDLSAMDSDVRKPRELDPKDAKFLKNMLIDKHMPKQTDPTTSGSEVVEYNPFKPNPKARAWTPQQYGAVAPAPRAPVGLLGWPGPVGPVGQVGIPGTGSNRTIVPEKKKKVESGGNVHTSIAREKQYWEVQDIQDAINHLFELTKGYIVRCHSIKGDVPKVEDKMLEHKEQSTWSYLLSLVDNGKIHTKNHMTFLLSVQQYRPYIIMRIALDYLFKKIISPQVFLGYSRELDDHLMALQGKMLSLKQSKVHHYPGERQQAVDEHARFIAHAMKEPAMRQFRDDTIKRHASMMANILQPLRSASVTDEDATKALKIMVNVTWELSSKVWMSGMTLHFTFPDCGNKFAFGTMDAANAAHLKLSAQELQYSQARIAFVVSPVLSVRDERDQKDLEVHTIKKSQVIVMK